MSLRVNIANQVRQTTVLAWRPLLPLFEAVMNSFQAIKEAKLPSNIPGQITIEVVRNRQQLDLEVPPISLVASVSSTTGSASMTEITTRSTQRSRHTSSREAGKA